MGSGGQHHYTQRGHQPAVNKHGSAHSSAKRIDAGPGRSRHRWMGTGNLMNNINRCFPIQFDGRVIAVLGRLRQPDADAEICPDRTCCLGLIASLHNDPGDRPSPSGRPRRALVVNPAARPRSSARSFQIAGSGPSFQYARSPCIKPKVGGSGSAQEGKPPTDESDPTDIVFYMNINATLSRENGWAILQRRPYALPEHHQTDAAGTLTQDSYTNESILTAKDSRHCGK